MKILITGICGFAGSRLARAIADRISGLEIFGIDNLSRPGSEQNRAALRDAGIRLFHGDLRLASDLETLPAADWVLDAAANPSVLAGIDGRSTSRQLLEHNLWGSVNILEYCRTNKSGLILLSSSRVYSIRDLAALPVAPQANAFRLDPSRPLPAGASLHGIAENFSVSAPVSLYGATKLASETLAVEYGAAFDFPVWIDRCGVLAGSGQFGTAEQGIFSYWLHAHRRQQKLRYLGFGGHGWQVRDALHPDDLAALIAKQIQSAASGGLLNAGGGLENSMSLAQLTAWCDQRFAPFAPHADGTERPFDIPWLVMDSRRARERFDWRPERNLSSILDEIARHADDHPDWIDRCLP